MSTTDYKSETVEVDYLAGLDKEDAELLIGKTIKKVINSEYHLKLVFIDNTELDINGHSYEDSSLDVELTI
ncbi:MAG: hypothetical protein ABJH98_18070 [Reichenbachiella sp.]|uniref:hypothetical protein n=1 Tax=Reichenbachiella sp. TaxID=2184521 RepID=UPI0032968A85